jgi:hypothetical protein
MCIYAMVRIAVSVESVIVEASNKSFDELGRLYILAN